MINIIKITTEILTFFDCYQVEKETSFYIVFHSQAV